MSPRLIALVLTAVQGNAIAYAVGEQFTTEDICRHERQITDVRTIRRHVRELADLVSYEQSAAFRGEELEQRLELVSVEIRSRCLVAVDRIAKRTA